MLRLTEATLLGVATTTKKEKYVSSHHLIWLDLWYAVCMNYNIIALVHVDSVLNTWIP